MRLLCFTLALVSAVAQDGPYKVIKTAKVGGAGGFDYVYADNDGRRLYIARRNPNRINVFNLDTLEPAGEIAEVSAAGVAVSAKSGHGFASSKPAAMWNTKDLSMIKKIEVEGRPDGILHDPFNDRVYIFSHVAPNATVIDASNGNVLGTIDLGGAPEQAATDGKGKIYVDIEDKGNVAVIDAKTMTVSAHYDLEGKGGVCAGLALDVKNEILFAACRNPQNMVILSAKDGKILGSVPLGAGTDGTVFNPKTNEAFSSQGDGTLTIVKDNAVEQTLKTMPSAKTLTFDAKTGHVLLIGAQFGEPKPPARRGEMVPDSFSILVVGK